MAKYLTSGSAIERVAICKASVALPHAHHETEYTQRGTAIHSFLEACSKVGRDDALAQVDEEWRDSCAELNLDGLHEQLSLAAEVALAYDVETDTARELGRGEGRAYDSVTESEIPATLDVVGCRPIVDGRRGLVIDWKSGFSTRRKIEHVVQLDFGALCVARAFGCDIVEVQLIHVHEGFAPWVQRKVIEGWEIDAFASYVRDIYDECKVLRAEMRAGKLPTDYSTGSWCDRCGARQWCPAQTSLLRSVLSKDLLDGPLRMSPIPPSVLAQLWNDLHAAQSVLSLAKAKVLAYASQTTISLGKNADGHDRWIGKVLAEGNEKIDGEIAYDVLSEMLGEDVALAATKVTASKKDIDAAIKLAVPRGKGAEKIREVYAELRVRDGAKRVWKQDVKEFTTKPSDMPALPPGESE